MKSGINLANERWPKSINSKSLFVEFSVSVIIVIPVFLMEQDARNLLVSHK